MMISRLLLKTRRGPQALWKDFRDPFSEDVNFSSCMHCITSCICVSCVGGRHVPIQVGKGNDTDTAFCSGRILGCVGDHAVRGLGSIFVLRASGLYTLGQKSVSLAHVQNICK